VSQQSSDPAEPEWISSFKLFALTAGISLVAFLMLLDTSVISIVREVISLVCGIGNSSKMLIVGRAVAGMGTSDIQTVHSQSLLQVFRCQSSQVRALRIKHPVNSLISEDNQYSTDWTFDGRSSKIFRRTEKAVTSNILLVSQLGIVIGPLVGGALTL
jgi:MFS family permease